MNEIDLGPIESFSALPAEITLNGTPYLLVRASEGRFRLFLAVCPHAGGEIRPLNEVLFCPLHFWTFNAEDGTCLNNPDERLMERNVEVRDGRLYAAGEDR